MREILLGMTAAAVLLLLNAVTSHGQELPRLNPTVKHTWDSDMDLRQWQDPKTGCWYFASRGSYGWFVIGGPILRRDGKPDCPDVDKK